jgi:hypothetical protein
MGNITYTFNRGRIEFVTTVDIPNEHNIEDIIKSLNDLFTISLLGDKIEAVHKKPIATVANSHDKLHTHPFMESLRNIDSDHVIVDRKDLEEAKKRLAKYEQDELLRGVEPLNRFCIAPELFQTLIAVLGFYGNINNYGTRFHVEKFAAINGDNESLRIRAPYTELGKDKGEAARNILKKLTNK